MIDTMSKRVFGSMMFLNHTVKRVFDTQTRITLVKTVWGMVNKMQISRVQRHQNFAAKVTSGEVQKYDPVISIRNI